MIVRLTIENFRSLKDEVVLDFISNSHIPDKQLKRKYRFGRVGVLKNIGLFGPNASGKTTIITALKEMRDFIVSNKISRNLAFKGSENVPTKFSLIFENNNLFYEYSFSIKENLQFNRPEVCEETITKLGMDGKNEELYSKENGLSWNTNPDLAAFERGYKNTFGLLFLNYIVAPERTLKGIPQLDELYSVYEYFAKKIFVSIYQQELMFSINESSINTIRDKLHDYDTGIENVSFNEITENERDILLSNKFVQNVVVKDLLSRPENMPSYFLNGEDIFLFKKDNSALHIQKLLFKHINIEEKFSFKDESDGTKVIFFLILTLLCSDNSDRAVIIDEIEKSSHPNVVVRVIKDFKKQQELNKSQLIFTSHLHQLMDEVLRRDEIYFVEKDDFGKSSLTSLLEFSTKNRREKISKKYLEGRYGAIPNLGVDANCNYGTR